MLDGKIVTSKYPLAYHITPEIGLINDPNGLVKFNDRYHVFYQWNPFGTIHKNKCWGHLVSSNLIDWKRMEPALVPSEYYDKDGIYSGSAIVKDSILYLFYTGNVVTSLNEKKSYQCLAISKDGINFEKKGPVFEHPMKYTRHVRDPKVWQDSNLVYWMILGAQKSNEIGDIILYRSDNLIDWEFKGTIFEEELKNMGYMFECPDLLRFGNKDVLIFSPQGIEAKENCFENIYQTGYVVGKFGDNEKFKVESEFYELDRGFEFYAPQSFVVDNRVLLFGWMGCMYPKEEETFPTITEGWIHCLTIPREVKFIDNKIIQQPVMELQKLRRKNELIEIEMDAKKEYRQFLKNPFAEILINFVQSPAQFSLNVSESFFIEYSKDLQRLKITRKNWYTLKEESRVGFLSGELKDLQIFLDGSSIEIFTNKGSLVMSSRYIVEHTLERYLTFNGSSLCGKISIFPLEGGKNDE